MAEQHTHGAGTVAPNVRIELDFVWALVGVPGCQEARGVGHGTLMAAVGAAIGQHRDLVDLYILGIAGQYALWIAARSGSLISANWAMSVASATVSTMSSRRNAANSRASAGLTLGELVDGQAGPDAHLDRVALGVQFIKELRLRTPHRA